MPDVVTVKVADLLAVLKENRETHRAKFLDAQAKFRLRAIDELDRSLADARKGNKVRLMIHLPEPEDHTVDYDREIRMLEMHQREAIEIRAAQFDQLVMDRWGWSGSFAASTLSYLGAHDEGD